MLPLVPVSGIRTHQSKDSRWIAARSDLGQNELHLRNCPCGKKKAFTCEADPRHAERIVTELGITSEGKCVDASASKKKLQQRMQRFTQ